MKNKKLLTLAVLPFMLASCGGADFDMYSQNIHYSSVIEPWDDVDKGTEENPGTNMTAKQIFTEGFNYIDWTKWPSIPHKNADEAIKGFNDYVSAGFKQNYSAVGVITDAKGSNPKLGTGTLNEGNQKSTKIFFDIDESGNQRTFEFKNSDGMDVAKLAINKTYNHSITNSNLSINGIICGIDIEINFTKPITSKNYEKIDLQFIANFVS